MRALVFQILWPLLVCLVGASPVPEIHRKHREIQNPTQIRERDYAKASKAPALEEFGSFGSVTLSASAPQEPLTNKNSPLQHEAKDMVQSPSSQDNSKSLADPFSGFFFDMQDMMKLLKEQMTEVLSRVPQDSSIVRENLVGPQDIKNQSSTKVDFQVRDKSPPRSVVNLMVKPGKISREEENENLIREYSNNLREEFDMNSNYGTVKLVIQKPIRSSMPEFDEESLEDVIKDSKKVPSKDLNKVEPRYSSLRQYENTLWDPVNSSKKSGSISTVNEYHQDVTANSERKSSNEDLMETSESRWNEQLDNRIDNYQPYYNYPMNYYANQLQYNRYPNYREAYYGNIPPSYNNYQPIYNGGYDRYVDLSGDTKVNDYMADQQQAGLISIDPDAELIDINKKPVQNAHLPKYRYSRL